MLEQNNAKAHLFRHEVQQKGVHTWDTHALSPDKLTQLAAFWKEFSALIPHVLPDHPDHKPQHFIRDRKLPLPKLISFILSLAVSGNEQGMAMLFEQFAENACDQGAWLHADSVSAAALTKARAKISWSVFSDLLKKTAALAQTLFPVADCYQWKKMSVYAIDGSKYQLPASAAIREHFDPDSGLDPDNPGRGHYPMALV